VNIVGHRFVKNIILDETLFYLFHSARRNVKLESAAGYFGIGTSVFLRKDWASLVATSHPQ